MSKFNILERNRFWLMKIAPHSSHSSLISPPHTSLIYLLLKWGFSRVNLFSSFRIGSYLRTKSRKFPKFLNLCKIYNFSVKLTKTLLKYARVMIWWMWTLARPKWGKFLQLIYHINAYSFLLKYPSAISFQLTDQL